MQRPEGALQEHADPGTPGTRPMLALRVIHAQGDEAGQLTMQGLSMPAG